jgi:hypothetical protein
VTDENQGERAWQYIRDNAKQHGQLRAHVKFTEYKIKRAWSQAFLEASGTVAERESRAWLSPEVETAVNERRDAMAEETMLEDTIESARLAFENWRTDQANQRKGIL